MAFIEHYPFILAFLLGLVPALVWLWFWLREETHHEPSRMVTLSFVGGMVAVLVVLPLEQFVYNTVQNSQTLSFILWAAIEEVFKFFFVYIIALRNKNVASAPTDDILYLIISALGFATFENTLFLLGPLRTGDIFGALINANLRFMGAMLLHVMSSAAIGIFLALAFYKSPAAKKIYALFGIILAIALHTAFNLFIISGTQSNIFWTFGMVWIGVIILLLVFEKIKHLRKTT